MVMGVAARSQIVVRCSQIAVASCILSSAFSPVAFYRYWFARCTLFTLHWSYSAENRMLLATPFLLFAVGYWLFASRCPVFVSRCLGLVSRYSPACCWLRITYCTLLVIPYSPRTAQLSLLSCLVSSTDRCTSSRIIHPCSQCVIRF